jgi:hypothetical protein
MALRAPIALRHVALMLAGALQRWLDRAGITAGAVFIGLTKGGKLTGSPLLPGDVDASCGDS